MQRLGLGDDPLGDLGRGADQRAGFDVVERRLVVERRPVEVGGLHLRLELAEVARHPADVAHLFGRGTPLAAIVADEHVPLHGKGHRILVDLGVRVAHADRSRERLQPGRDEWGGPALGDGLHHQRVRTHHERGDAILYRRHRDIESTAVVLHVPVDRLVDEIPRVETTLISIVERHAELGELSRLIAEAETEDQSPGGEGIGQAHVFGETQRLVERQHDHGRAETDPRCGLGHMCNHQQWARDDRVVGEVVLGEPGDVEVGLFRQLHLGTGLGQQSGGVTAWRRQGGQVENAELHAGHRSESGRGHVEAHRHRHRYLRRVERDEPDRARQPVGGGQVDRVRKP